MGGIARTGGIDPDGDTEAMRSGIVEADRPLWAGLLPYTKDQFLAGPRHRAEDLDIDAVFSKGWDSLLQEMRQFDPAGLEPTGENATPSDLEPEYSFLSVNSGVVLLDASGAWVGGYLSCDLAVDEGHQGIGLGKELIVEYFLRHQGLPSWHLDAPAYSPAGEAAHRAAYDFLQTERTIVDRKLNRLMIERDVFSKMFFSAAPN